MMDIFVVAHDLPLWQPNSSLEMGRLVAVGGGQGGGWAGVEGGRLTAMLHAVEVVKLAPPPPVATK